LPIATNADGSPITGHVRAEYDLTAATSTVDITRRPAYAAASLDNADASLTRRVHQSDARESIDNRKWAFADCTNAPFPGKPDPGKVCVDGGFDTNHIYELVYTGKNPTVAGIGFAATRDFAAFLRGDSADASVVNPLAGGIDHTLIFGSSQSGRWIRTFIDLGFNESESHKKVFDGAIPHKASNSGSLQRPLRAADPAFRHAAHRGPVSRPGIAADLECQHRPDLRRNRRTTGALPQVADLPEDYRHLHGLRILAGHDGA
jgi:hypothetical protein